MSNAFILNYGENFRVSVNLWKSSQDDKIQGFFFDNNFGWLSLDKKGWSYFIAMRPYDS